MSQELIAFDITKSETSGRKIRSESDALKRLSDKLKRAVDNTSSWWLGDSRNGFARQADELIGLMSKTVDLVTDLGEDMLAIAKAKKEDEVHLKSELAGALAVEFGVGASGTGSAGTGASGTGATGAGEAGTGEAGAGFATAAGTNGFIPGTAQYTATGEYPGKSEFGGAGEFEKNFKEKKQKKYRYNPETKKFEEGGELWDEGKSVLSAEYKYSDSIAYAGAEAYGKNDFAEGSAGIYVGYAEGHVGAGAGVYAYGDDGSKVFAPGVHAEIGGSVSAVYGKANGKLGNDWIGAYGGVEGSVGEVSAEIGGSAGVFKKEGGGYTVDVHAGVSAEAIAAEASGKLGATVLGTDIGVTAGVNVGIGAHADVGLKDGKFKVDVGASLGVGISVGLEVDIGGTVDAVIGAAGSVFDGVKGFFGW